MANILTGNPLIIDTQTATDLMGATQRLKIAGVRWIGGTTAGHLAELTDTAGRTVFKAVATAANQERESSIPFTCTGLKAPDLDSGIVYVYLQEPLT